MKSLAFQMYSVGSKVGNFKGWYEPEDRSWILFVQDNGNGLFYSERDPNTGAVIT